MPPEESPEAKYNRLKRQLQESILTEYPNPERKGCPGDVVVRSFAERASDENVEEDPNWYHLTHCSECYREFLDLRFRLRAESKRRTRFVIWAAAAVFVLAAVLFFGYEHRGIFDTERPKNAELAYRKLTIDIPVMTRSENARASTPIVLPREPVELTMNLPIGSKRGEYELRLLKDNEAVVSAHAAATILSGTAAFLVKVNLSAIASGTYSLSVRQVPWDWSYFPVVVQ